MLLDVDEDMIAILLMAALQAAEPQIVVTGMRLEDAYAECIRRRCSPLRDAEVSIAWAEKLFRKGDYSKAKYALGDAVSRNRGFAKSDPKPVAALYEAYATVALQDGDIPVYRRATAWQVQTLRDNLPPTDPAVADSALVTGDMWLHLGKADNADASYQAAEREARSRGQNRVALFAALRRVALASTTGQAALAKHLLDEIVADPGVQDPTIQAILPVYRLQQAAARSNDAEISHLIAQLPKGGAGGEPFLIWAPPYEPTASSDAEDSALKFGEKTVGAPKSSEFDSVQWVDVGFWIRPNGRTDDVEVLRGTPGRAWTTPVVTQISNRRYAPLSAGFSTEGTYRIERFTLRGTFGTPIGSLISRRSGAQRLEVVDLTESEGPSASAR